MVVRRNEMCETFGGSPEGRWWWMEEEVSIPGAGEENQTLVMVCWGDFPGSPSPKCHKERSLGLQRYTVGEGREDFRCEG